MSTAYTKMPDDSTNTGDKLRNNARTVNGVVVVERYTLLSDPLADLQARLLTAAPVGTEPGLVTRNIPSGTQPVSGSGTFTVVNAGTFAVQSSQAGVWSVAVNNLPQTQTISGNVGITGNVAVTGALTDTQLRAAAVPVSGTVTSNVGTGTRAVSATALPLPTGASTAAKQPALGVAGTASTDVLSVQGIASMTPLKVDGSGVTQPVSGSFFQNVQPVSGTITANAGTGTFAISAVSLPLPTGASTETTLALLNTKATSLTSSSLMLTGTAASGAAVTVTLPAPAAGQFHYITSIEISLYSALARTGTATPWVVTSTNLPGNPAWTFGTAGAVGTVDRYPMAPTTPIRSSVAATNTTIVAPIATGGIWRINVSYFMA